MNLVVLIWNQRCGCQNDYDDYDICITSKVLSTKFFLVAKGKTVTSRWRNLADATLTTGSKLTSPVLKHQYHIPLISYQKSTSSFLWHSCQMHKLKLIMRKPKRKLRNILQSNWYMICASKVSRPWKTEREWGTVPRWRRRWRHDN